MSKLWGFSKRAHSLVCTYEDGYTRATNLCESRRPSMHCSWLIYMPTIYCLMQPYLIYIIITNIIMLYFSKLSLNRNYKMQWRYVTGKCILCKTSLRHNTIKDICCVRHQSCTTNTKSSIFRSSRYSEPSNYTMTFMMQLIVVLATAAVIQLLC